MAQGITNTLNDIGLLVDELTTRMAVKREVVRDAYRSRVATNIKRFQVYFRQEAKT